MVFSYRMTGGWTDWLAPEVLPSLIIQFLPFLIILPLLIAAACLWRKHRSGAKVCLKATLVAFVIGTVWEMLIL